MRPRVIEDGDLLDRLLDAFADLGYEGTSIRELCRHLGVSHNLIHTRYQSKEGAWYAAVDHGFRQLYGMLLTEPEEIPDDDFEVLRLAMQKFAAASIARPALNRIIQQEAARSGPRFDHMFREYIGPVRESTRQLLERLQEQGRVRPGAVQTVYFFLTTWGIGGLASLPADGSGHPGLNGSAAEVAELAVEVVIDGLRPPDGRT